MDIVEYLTYGFVVIVGVYFGFTIKTILDKRKRKENQQQYPQKEHKTDYNDLMTRIKWEEVIKTIQYIVMALFGLWIVLMMIETIL